MRILKKYIRSALELFLSMLGFKLARKDQCITQQTDLKDLQRLISQLKPINIDTPLIRFGPNGDGGYLLPDDLDGVTACFSPGVSAISGFELDCAERGMNVFLADKSVDSAAEDHEHFHFIRNYIGAYNNDEFMTINDWVSDSKIKPDDDLILQMDIEGFEYEAILNLSEESQSKFRIIVIEFHFLEQLWNRPFFNISSRAFEKLLNTHECVHIHPNNYAPPEEYNGLMIPPLLEMTFLRKDRVVKNNEPRSFPHDLDFDNTDMDSFPLPECWH